MTLAKNEQPIFRIAEEIDMYFVPLSTANFFYCSNCLRIQGHTRPLRKCVECVRGSLPHGMISLGKGRDGWFSAMGFVQAMIANVKLGLIQAASAPFPCGVSVGLMESLNPQTIDRIAGSASTHVIAGCCRVMREARGTDKANHLISQWLNGSATDAKLSRPRAAC